MQTTSYINGVAQTISAGFNAAATARVRNIAYQVLVEWTRGSGAWTDESDLVTSLEWKQTVQLPGEELIPPGGNGALTVRLRNQGWRYSWKRVSGGDAAIRNQINGPAGLKGKQIIARVGVKVGNQYELIQIFRGVIDAWQEASDEKSVTLTAVDRGGGELLQLRGSTAMTANTYASAWIRSLATDLAGLIANDLLLDEGVLTLPYAWVDDDSLMEDIWRAAASEGGRAYWDPAGKLRFEAADHWFRSDHLTIRSTLDNGDYRTLDLEIYDQALATELVYEWAQRRLEDETEIYTLDEPKLIGPGETVSFEARLSSPCFSLTAPEAEKDYWLMTTGGHPLNQQCVVSLTSQAAGRASVRIQNNHPSQAALLVYFRLRGAPLQGGPTQQERRTLANPALTVKRVRSVRANDYAQSQAHASYLLPLLEVTCRQALTVYRLGGAWANPALELGDRVQFNDNRTLDTIHSGWIVGIEGKYTLTDGLRLDLRIWDDAGLVSGAAYFVIGATALGAGVAWY